MTSRARLATAALTLAGGAAGLACTGEAPARCGPARGVVAEVTDGDTITLFSGEKVRYLMIDTPESTGSAADCYGAESAQLNRELVQGKEVELAYDVECEDRFGRLLAYVSIGGREVNSLLVERGHACVLYVPPNGEERLLEFQALEAQAKAAGRGMWSACEEVSCE